MRERMLPAWLTEQRVIIFRVLLISGELTKLITIIIRKDSLNEKCCGLYSPF
jgi:hypothetical protein